MINNLLIISLDALNAKDLSYLRTLTNFKYFMEHGSYIKSVESIYPSLTYCCHTSIITGTYPYRHGIYHNEIANPKDPLRQEWHWHKKSIQVPTLFDAAKRKRLKTASVLWPVMANAKSAIDYNIPEIWSDHGKSMFSLYLKNGSMSMLPLVLKHRHLLNGKSQPQLDDFIEATSTDIIVQKKPHLMGIHFTELDSIRHVHGVFSDEAYHVLDKMDQRLGRLIEALKSAGLYNTTNIVLLGDHGGNDFSHVIFLNTLFKKEGLSNDVYANSAGGSVQIQLKNPTNTTLYSRVQQVLSDFVEMNNSPIKHFFTREEIIASHHLDGPYSFILEAKDGYIFRNHTLNQIVVPREQLPNCYRSDHGFLPEHENLKTLFLAMGPDIRSGAVLDHAHLVDEAPTFAKLLKVALPDVDGRVLDELLIK
ncbi:ectonucleotide pyrophosphatase/phosphodiesterase [Vallitaleaceae bacterium 9-2]